MVTSYEQSVFGGIEDTFNASEYTSNKSLFHRKVQFASFLPELSSILSPMEWFDLSITLLNDLKKDDFVFREQEDIHGRLGVYMSPERHMILRRMFPKFLDKLEREKMVTSRVTYDAGRMHPLLRGISKSVSRSFITEEGLDKIVSLMQQTSWYRRDLSQAEVFEIVSRDTRSFLTGVGLFGSFARNQQNELSDVDLVLFDTVTRKTPEAIPLNTAFRKYFQSRLSADLGRPVNFIAWCALSKKAKSRITPHMIYFPRSGLCSITLWDDLVLEKEGADLRMKGEGDNAF
jgi:predicted nucleotidyltransferase